MVESKRNVAAPCGLYCGACMIHIAYKRENSEFLKQIKAQFTQLLSNVENGEMPFSSFPPTKNLDRNLDWMKREMQEEACMDCKGCLSDVLAIQCRICGFRECTEEKGITTCAECPDMPCQWVIDFNNDGMPHHGEVIANLNRQKEIGIDAWLAEQEERWRCVQCKSPLSWYDTDCPNCHATPSQTFESSPF